MTTPTHVEVAFTIDNPAAEVARNFWGEPIPATRVQWRANAGRKGVLVCVTAFAETHQNRSWYDPRFFVADGLNTSARPEWIPDAPDWFWAIVETMTAQYAISGAAS